MDRQMFGRMHRKIAVPVIHVLVKDDVNNVVRECLQRKEAIAKELLQKHESKKEKDDISNETEVGNW